MTVRRPRGPGPGSFRLLAWIARLGVSGIEPARLALGINQATAYSHIARLARAGLLWRVQVGDGHGAAVVLTRAADQRRVGLAAPDRCSADGRDGWAGAGGRGTPDVLASARSTAARQHYVPALTGRPCARCGCPADPL